jgi:hypothetical protein
MYYLVKSYFDWADEMDLTGFAVLSEVNKIAIETALAEYEDEIVFSVGTNEEVVFDNGLELLSCLVFTEITDEKAELLHGMFNEYSDIDETEMVIEYLLDLAPEAEEESIISYVEELNRKSAKYKNLLAKADEYFNIRAVEYELSYGFDLTSYVSDLMEG